MNLCYMVLISSSNSKKCCIPYSGKTWWALNLPILAKTLFFNLASFSFGNSVRQPTNTITTATYISYMAARRSVKCLVTLDGPFLAPYLPISTLSSGVYLLYFTWLRGETALECVGPRFAPTSNSHYL